jgi:hypothetical protein
VRFAVLPLGVGGVGGRAGRGGPAIKGRLAVESSPSGIVGGFRWWYSALVRLTLSKLNHHSPPNHYHLPPNHRFNHYHLPLQVCARASAMTRFPKFFCWECASGQAATRCLSSSRGTRRSVSVVRCAVELCGTCSIGRGTIGGGGERLRNRSVRMRGRRQVHGRDVFIDCATVQPGYDPMTPGARNGRVG